MSPLALSLRFLRAQPDSRLIALAREGHEPAFEALVCRYRTELLAYCRRLQPRSGSAEDALQQALLQAWRALNAGAEVREARPWLYRIAHNVTLNHIQVAVAVPQEAREGIGGHDVHQLVEQRLQARAALANMASLPALQRDVFVSTTLNGASHEEIAGALGISSGAVRGLIYRARATLRSAAAALIPTPMVDWAIRRTERTGGAGMIPEAVAGGGGAGVVAVIAKGGAVLTLAGAVAGTGGVILSHAASHHDRHGERVGTAAAGEARAAAPARVPAANAQVEMAFTLPLTADRRQRAIQLRGEAKRADNGQHRGSGSSGMDVRAPSRVSTSQTGGRSSGGSGGGSSTAPSGVPQGGSPAAPSSGGPAAGAGGSSGSGGSTGSSGTSGSSSSSGSSGSSGSTGTSGTSATSGSGGGSALTSSGSGGGTSNGGPAPSTGTQPGATEASADTSSGSDTGSLSSSPSSADSVDTTTTNSD